MSIAIGIAVAATRVIVRPAVEFRDFLLLRAQNTV